MSDPHEGRPFPKGVLYAAAGMIGVTIALVIAAQTTGFGRVENPEGEAVRSVKVRFEERPDGSMVALRGTSNRVMAVFESTTKGFVWGVVRGMDRQRKLEEVDSDAPYTVTYWDNGQLSLSDDLTGRIVYLNAFGPTNLKNFARVLGSAGSPEQAMTGGTP